MNRKSSISSGSRKRKSSAPVRRIEGDNEMNEIDQQLNETDFLEGFDLDALFQRAVTNVKSRIARMSNEEIEEAVQSAQKRCKDQFNIFVEESFAIESPERKALSGKKKKVPKKSTLSLRKSSLPKNARKQSSLARKQSLNTTSPTKHLKKSNLVEVEKLKKKNVPMSRQKSSAKTHSQNKPVSGKPKKQNDSLEIKKKKEITAPLLTTKSRRAICIPERYEPETKSLSNRLERRRRQMDRRREKMIEQQKKSDSKTTVTL